MAVLKCEICGGKLVGKARGIFQCEFCGLEYDTSWVKEKVQEIRGTVQVEGTVEVTGRVQIEGVTNAASLLKRGFMSLEDRDWENADEYFDKVLDINPTDGEAYFGKLMTELMISSITELDPGADGVRHTVMSARTYKRFEQFAPIERKAELESRLSECDEAEENRKEYARRKKEDKVKRLSPLMARCEKFSKLISAYPSSAVGVKSDGTVIPNIFPSSISAEWCDIAAISASPYHIVGLKLDGSVIAFSSLFETLSGFDRRFIDVSDWTDIVAISANRGYTVGLRANGTVVAAGNDYLSDFEAMRWRNITAISAGACHVVGLKADGTVVAVKSVDEIEYYGGQCDVSEWSDIVAVSAGYAHTVGLHSDGTVVATKYIGNKETHYGQCDISDWEDIIAISAGVSHTVGLRSDGTVVAVGDNCFGQCDVSGWKNVVAVYASDNRTIGLKSDGTILEAHNRKFGLNIPKDGIRLFDNADTYEDEVAENRNNLNATKNIYTQ